MNSYSDTRHNALASTRHTAFNGIPTTDVYSLDNVLQQRLNAFVGGERSESQLLQDLSGLCVTPDAAWEALALIDQYHRRGKLSAEIACAARQKIERKLFGVQESYDDHEIARPVARVFTADGLVTDLGAARARRAVPHLSPTASPVPDLAPELAATRAQLAATQAELSTLKYRLAHYRHRLNILARFGRNRRHDLTSTRRELGIVSMQAAGYLERIGSLQQRQTDLLLTADVPPPDTHGAVRRDRRVAWLQGAALLALLLGAVMMPAYQYLRLRATPPPAPPAEVAAKPVPAPSQPAPGTLSWSSDRYVVRPGDSTVYLSVQRLAGTDGAASFEWWTEPAGARSGVDYIGVRANAARLADGEQTLPLRVRILPNSARPHTEMFYVLIGNPRGGAALGDLRRATVFILPK